MRHCDKLVFVIANVCSSQDSWWTLEKLKKVCEMANMASTHADLIGNQTFIALASNVLTSLIQFMLDEFTCGEIHDTGYQLVIV